MSESLRLNFDENRLALLVDLALNKSIGQTELTELQSILKDNPAAKSFYLSEIETEFLLNDLTEASSQAPPAIFPDVGVSKDPVSESESSLPLSIKPWFIGVLAFALLGTWFALKDWNTKPDSINEVIAHPASESNRTKWFVEQTGDPVNGVRTGDILRVIEGRLSLNYVSGVSVNLDAPVACELVSATEVKMLLGSLTAEVPDGCEGFSVEAPRATVVDLGTKFRVNVDERGETDVVVFKGEVDVDYHQQPNPKQRLRMGEAVRLDAFGGVERLVSIRNGDFVNPAEEARGLLIEEVKDNYDRDSSLNYYEIVQNGMREDALAFVDREGHEWNGIEDSGMPAYLMGGDYVRTFNNDKANDQIRIKVKVAAPCKLYILFDNRLPVTDWLKKDFQDTGDDIGLDNGPFMTNGKWHNKGPSGVGPGNSIDDEFSIWVKEIEKPCVVTLGATESPLSKPNMYGIVAVPLQKAN